MLEKTPPILQARLNGIAHAVVEVGDLETAERFYVSLLGFNPVGRDRWPLTDGGPSTTLKTDSGRYLILAERTSRNDPRLSAVHVGYRVPAGMRDRLIGVLGENGISVHRYREDRPSEASDNVYCEDPFGNRIQLVARGLAGREEPPAIDHVALETNNILWAREFYGVWLNLPIEHRVGWKTQDYIDAKALGEDGMTAAMPGARYWNERYSQFEKERKALRPNVQLYFSLGNGGSIAVYLATRQYQAPRDDIIHGTPALGLRVDKADLQNLADGFQAHGRIVEGPVTHDSDAPISASVYVKDPGGNFLEFCAAR